MIEKHCVSLELSKKLKELGVPQKSEFYWLRGADPKEGIWTIVHKQIMEDVIYDKRNLPTSAYLASELGEMLPNYINIPYKNGKTKSPNHFLVLKKYPVDKHNWGIRYYRTSRSINIEKRADTEADARAKMLIYLIENSLFKLEDLV